MTRDNNWQAHCIVRLLPMQCIFCRVAYNVAPSVLVYHAVSCSDVTHMVQGKA